MIYWLKLHARFPRRVSYRVDKWRATWPAFPLAPHRTVLEPFNSHGSPENHLNKAHESVGDKDNTQPVSFGCDMPSLPAIAPQHLLWPYDEYPWDAECDELPIYGWFNGCCYWWKNSLCYGNFFEKENTAQIFTIFMHFIFAGIGGIVVLILKIIDSTADIGKLLNWVFKLIPSFCLTNSIMFSSSKQILFVVDP